MAVTSKRLDLLWAEAARLPGLAPLQATHSLAGMEVAVCSSHRHRLLTPPTTSPLQPCPPRSPRTSCSPALWTSGFLCLSVASMPFLLLHKYSGQASRFASHLWLFYFHPRQGFIPLADTSLLWSTAHVSPCRLSGVIRSITMWPSHRNPNFSPGQTTQIPKRQYRPSTQTCSVCIPGSVHEPPSASRPSWEPRLPLH